MYCDVMRMRATLDTGVECYIILKLKNPARDKWGGGGGGGLSGIRPPQLTGTIGAREERRSRRHARVGP